MVSLQAPVSLPTALCLYSLIILYMKKYNIRAGKCSIQSNMKDNKELSEQPHHCEPWITLIYFYSSFSQMSLHNQLYFPSIAEHKKYKLTKWKNAIHSTNYMNIQTEFHGCKHNGITNTERKKCLIDLYLISFYVFSH